jgi:hypothetical protein
VLLLAEPDQEVVRLYIAMQETLLVNELDPLQHLDGYHEDRLKRKLSPIVLKQILAGWPE